LLLSFLARFYGSVCQAGRSWFAQSPLLRYLRCKDHVRARGGQFLFFDFEEEEGAERGVAFPGREGKMMIRMKAVSGSNPSHRLLISRVASANVEEPL
jgi:hypothetical protein